MGQRQLTIFCNAGLEPEAMTLLVEATRDHHLLIDHPDCAQADIAFGQPEPQQIIAAPRLQWVHLTTAGYTRYDTDAMREILRRRGMLLTNSSRVYDAPCAQHLLAMMMADARQLLPSYARQLSDRDWPQGPRRRASYLLNGQTVLLLGLGAIAQYLIRLLQPFEVQIIAVRRSGQTYDGIEVVPESALNDVLPRADHVVNVLPETPTTAHFMNTARFARLQPGAKFYNVGRGKTVDQDALLAVLHAGHLGAAYLDVTDPEPLPPEHPLWTAPNCFITPHSAGGHQGEGRRLVQHFIRNLRAFESGEPLIDRVLGT